MTRRRRTLVLNVALAAVVLAGATTTYLLLSDRSAGAQAATTRTVAAQTMDVSSTVTANGTLAAVEQVAANFGTAGTVTSVRVRVGDKVAKGDVLATLDKSDARTEVRLAQASLVAAQASLAKAEDGTTTTTTDPQTGRTTSTTTVDDAQVASATAQVEQAESALDDAQHSLADTVLRAPIAGTVMSVNAIVGGTVSGGATGGSATSGDTSAGADVVTIANLTSMQVAVTFSESDIASIEVGQTASITFPAVDGVTATGTVVSIDPNPTTADSVVSYAAVVRLAAVPDGVRLGQSAEVVVTTASARDVVAVPSLAITTAGKRSFVTVVEDGVATPTPVETGIEGTSYTEITSGLSAGDQVRLDLSAGTDSTSTTTRTGQGGPVSGGGGGGPAGGAPAVTP